ncbi:unnamed protein product [Ceratitis capitata]|uniref:(Mediterranean fruit fly) hypothetical protein n=1 Tax=Ceratitis capitata TaxID=7213 RepID=A0A811UQN4_CERCA|nr:unnamed protein product [Ceratitis capitata]
MGQTNQQDYTNTHKDTTIIISSRHREISTITHLLAQKPQPKPEPMDIDPSIRINAINYANRPNLKYAGKRQPDSNLSNPPMKAQRNFHLKDHNYTLKDQIFSTDHNTNMGQTNQQDYTNTHKDTTIIISSRHREISTITHLLAQKPQPKPEPMDIDPSIRINAINYANRPNLKYAGKRQPDSNLSNPPMKAQRNFHNGFDNYNFRPPLPPRNYPKSPQFYPDLAHLAQPQQRFMSYQVAQRPQLHPQRPNIFNRPQYQHGPNQPTGLYQYPQGYHNYNQQQTQRNQHYNPPPSQKPQPKPEPMDIDPSIRINAINYANRPNLKYAGKRQPDSNLSNPPMLAQRNFHVSTSPEEAETSFDNKDNTPPITFEQYGVENPDFYPYNYENAYFTDIQFLE